MNQKLLTAVSVLALLTSVSAHADSYAEAGADWRALATWSNAQTGDRAAGINYWAANRNVAGHLSCADAASSYQLFGNAKTFADACLEAKHRLDPIDDRRHSDDQYRLGFNDAAKQIPLAQTGAWIPGKSTEPDTHVAGQVGGGENWCSRAQPGTMCKPGPTPAPTKPVEPAPTIYNPTPAPASQAPVPAVSAKPDEPRYMRLYVSGGGCNVTTGWMSLGPNDKVPAGATIETGWKSPFTISTGVPEDTLRTLRLTSRAVGLDEAEADKVIKQSHAALLDGKVAGMCQMVGPFTDAGDFYQKATQKYHDLAHDDAIRNGGRDPEALR